jgi:hypothetical protein
MVHLIPLVGCLVALSQNKNKAACCTTVDRRNRIVAAAASMLLFGSGALIRRGHALDCTVANHKQTRKNSNQKRLEEKFK